MMEKTKTLLSEHVNVANETKDKNLVGVFLYGSQNYGLDTENSDVDTKAFYVPTLSQLCKLNHSGSDLRTVGDGTLLFRDVREHFALMHKQAFNDLEWLFTDYYYVNDNYVDLVDELKARREEVTRMNPVKCANAMRGMANKSYKEYLVCGKDKRLAYALKFARAYHNYVVKDTSFAECLRPSDEEMFMEARRLKDMEHPEEAFLAVKGTFGTLMYEADAALEMKHYSANKETEKFLEKVLCEFVRRGLFCFNLVDEIDY